MEGFASSPEGRARLGLRKDDYINDERVLYDILVRSGVLDGAFDFEAFERLMEKALNEDIQYYEYGPVLAGVESVLTQLGVMPFDEASLPPEDPNTF